MKLPRKKWLLWTVATCLCLVLAGALLLSRPRSAGPNGLPLLEVSLDGGTDAEGLLCRDFSEWDSGNPWREDMALDTLPVFRSASSSTAGKASILLPSDKEKAAIRKLEQRAAAAAQVLGAESFRIEPHNYSLSPAAAVWGKAEGLRVDVEAGGTMTIRFDGGRPLPEEYRFPCTDTSSQQAEAALDYLMDRYATLLNFQQPQKVLSGSCNIHGKLDRDYYVYDAAGDDVEDLLNYAFRRAQFSPDRDGNLTLIHLRDGLTGAEKLGDYPLISLDEARELLLEGRYITTVPYSFPGEDHVYGGELIYRGGAAEKNLIPYYRFYVDVTHGYSDSGWADGLNYFAAYDVPAVQPQYLKPGWEREG